MCIRDNETNVGAALESVRVGAPLVAWRRVDAVAVNVALLLQGLVPDLPALRRDVDEGAPGADLEPGVQGLVGDEAVVPPELEHADHVSAVVGQPVPDLELE